MHYRAVGERLRKAGLYLGLVSRPETLDPPVALPWRVILPSSLLAGLVFGSLQYLTNGHHPWAGVGSGLFFGAIWGPGFRWLLPRWNQRLEHRKQRKR